MGRWTLAVLLFAALTPAAQGQAVADWVGRYPHELLAETDLQAALLRLVGQDGLRRLGDDMGIEEPMARDGDWIVATGCAPHLCGDVMAGFALSIMTSRIVAVARDEAGITVWGEALPQALAVMARP